MNYREKREKFHAMILSTAKFQQLNHSWSVSENSRGYIMYMNVLRIVQYQKGCDQNLTVDANSL